MKRPYKISIPPTSQEELLQKAIQNQNYEREAVKQAWWAKKEANDTKLPIPTFLPVQSRISPFRAIIKLARELLV